MTWRSDKYKAAAARRKKLRPAQRGPKPGSIIYYKTNEGLREALANLNARTSGEDQ